MILNILSMVAGLGLVVLTLGDIFQVVVVPRSTGRRYRISFTLWRLDVADVAEGRMARALPRTPTGAKD